MAVTTTNLGVITAYGDAVAAGYTGTKAEWQTLMASYATVGQQAVDAKDDAVAAKNTAVSKATEATTAANTATTKAGEASASAQSIAQSASQIAQNTSDISELKEDLTQKANIDGSYEDLVSGGAYQIISNMEEVDNTPYGYRTAGGSLEIGDREKLKKIVGGSLPVNQWMPNAATISSYNDVSATANGDGSYTINGTASGIGSLGLLSISEVNGKLLANHVYFLSGCPQNGSRQTYYVGIAGVDVDKGNGGLYKHTYDFTSSNFRFDFASGQSFDNVVIWPQYIDLTLMLGSTIADYVYTLETTTAGAGVAWLKAHFPKIFDSGYIPYNAGTLEHVSGLSAHKMTGFNQWDEEWEVGRIDPSTGGNISQSDAIRSKNYIRCVPNTAYYYQIPLGKGNIQVCFYDADKSYVGFYDFTTVHTFITPVNCCYMRFCTGANYGTTYNRDICINLHWDGERDGEYEPYEEHSYPLDSDVTLRGIPKLDASNHLYYDGDTYESDGTVTRRFGIVDLGTLNYVYETSVANTHFFTGGVSMPKLPKFKGALVSSLYIWKPNGGYASIGNMEMCVDNSESTPVLRIKNDSYDNATTFKAAMSGVMLVYELATPTTEEADPYTEIQNVSNWGTEEFVTTSLVPVGHETAYQPDLRAKIEVAPESPDTDGYYLMKRENGENAYVAYLGELPSDPTTDGTYTLKCTVTSGTATKTWEADE